LHGEQGWDEATQLGRFDLFDVSPGIVHQEQRDPRDVGIPRCKPEQLQGGDAAYNAQAIEDVFNRIDRGPHRDALVLAAGLILEVTGRAPRLAEGVRLATRTLDDGDAVRFLKQLRAFSESI